MRLYYKNIIKIYYENIIFNNCEKKYSQHIIKYNMKIYLTLVYSKLQL